MKRMTCIGGRLTACIGALAFLPLAPGGVTVTTVEELVAAVALPTDQTCIILLPGATYTLTQPLVIGTRDELHIEGNNATIVASDVAAFQDGFIIEAQGADRLHLANVHLHSAVTGSNMLAGALLLGRTDTLDGYSGGRHLFENVLIDGQYEFSSVVNVNSEINTWINCYVENNGNAGSDNSYAFYMSSLPPLATWAASTPYAADAFVRPTTPNGFMYKADNTGGTSTGSEPTWPLTVGGTVTVSDITWTCYAIGPIASADFSGMDGSALRIAGSTMTGQTFINTHFGRFWEAAGSDADDAVFYFDNTRGGSFGNFYFRNSWFNCNTSSGGAASTHATNIEALMRYNATNESTFNLSFENCVSEGDECNEVLLFEGSTIQHGLVMKANHWTAGERIVVTGEGVRLMGARIDEDGFVTGADYNWAYDDASPYAFHSTPVDGDTRCLYDIQNCYGCSINGAAPGFSIQQDPAGTGVRGDLGGGTLRTEADRRPWSIARVRNICLHNEFITYEINDVLPIGVGGSQIPRTQIRRQDAGVFLNASVEGALNVAAGANVDAARVGGVLYVNTTDVGNVNTADPDDLMSYTLPANVLNANGKVLRVTCWGTTSSTGNAKTVAFNFGSETALTKQIAVFAGGTWCITATIVRTGSNTQYMFVEQYNNKASSVAQTDSGAVLKQASHVAATQTDSSTITIKCTATTCTTTNDIVQKGMLVEVLN